MSTTAYSTTVVDATLPPPLGVAPPLPPPPAKKTGIRSRKQAAEEAAEAKRHASLPQYFERIAEYIPDGTDDVKFLPCIAPYADVQLIENHFKPVRRRCHCCANDLIVNTAAAHKSDCKKLHGWGGARLMVTMSEKEYKALTARINRTGKKVGLKFEYFRVIDLFGFNWVFIEPECSVGVELPDPFQILDELYLRSVKPWGCITSSRPRTGTGAAQRKAAEDHLTECTAEADKTREVEAEAERVASLAYVEERAARLATPAPPGCASNNPSDMYELSADEIAAAEAAEQERQQERKEREAADEQERKERTAAAAAQRQREFDALPEDSKRIFRMLEQGVRPKKRRLPLNWKGCEEIGDTLGGKWVHLGAKRWYRIPPRNLNEFERRVAGGVADDCTDYPAGAAS